MRSPEILSGIQGWQSVIDWFGLTPNFHDAEIISVNLNSNAASSIRIHAWVTTDSITESGHYLTEKHAVVVVAFASVQVIELDDFDTGSVIFDLEFEGALTQTEMTWTSSYGAAGRIVGRGMNLSVIPGKPKRPDDHSVTDNGRPEMNP